MPGYYGHELGSTGCREAIGATSGYGSSYLSKAKLLAIIQRNSAPSVSELSLSTRLQCHFGGLKGLARANYDDLRSIHGLGEAKMAKVRDTLGWVYAFHPYHDHESQRADIHSPQDAAKPIQSEIASLEQEVL